MKSQKIGRLELLTWLNELVDCDYPKIESCSDGVGYCQVIDAIYPNIVNLSRLNFNAKFTEEFQRNLRVLDEAFNKLELDKTVPVEKLSKGKFQDNMNFLQWLYNHASKKGPFGLKNYKGYEKRVESLKKQKVRSPTMNAYLIPNNAILKFKNKTLTEEDQIENFGGVSQNVQNRISNFEGFAKELEADLKLKMEYNWKLLYALDDMFYQRNTLFSILHKIEEVTNKSQNSAIKQNISNILNHIPEDFKSTKEID